MGSCKKSSLVQARSKCLFGNSEPLCRSGLCIHFNLGLHTHTHTHGYIKHRESQITQRYIFSFNPDQLHASCQVCSPSAHKISRQHTTMQASTLLRKPAHYYARQHTTTQDSTLLRDPAHYNARQHTTTQDSTLQRKPALYYARQHSTTRARPCCVLYFLCLGNAKSKALKHSPCFGSCTFLCLKHHNHL
jgi:hypothetical protein